MKNTQDKLKKVSQEINTNNTKIYFAFSFLKASIKLGINELIDFNKYLAV